MGRRASALLAGVVRQRAAVVTAPLPLGSGPCKELQPHSTAAYAQNCGLTSNIYRHPAVNGCTCRPVGVLIS